MITYSYTAKNPKTGQIVHSTVQADSEAAAAKLISGEGLIATNIQQGSEGFLPGLGCNKVKSKDRVLFSRQLSTLINAGLPLLQALRSVSRTITSKPFKVVLSQVIGDVEGGSALAKAMGKHPKVFNRMYISLIEAGESSGTLDRALERLAVQQEKEADLQSKIRGAMMYPLVVTLVMIAVVIFMVVTVIPQVGNMYQEMGGGKMPVPTLVMMWLADFIIKRWYVVVAILAVVGFSTTKWARTGGGKEVIDKMKLKMWPTATLFQKIYMARFTRTASTLVAAGVPLLQVLDISSEAVNNIHVERAIMRAGEKVKGGKSLADAMEGDENFSDMVPNMIRIGEQSGALEQMMAKIADYYEKETDDAIAAISTIIEPVMMVMLGLIAIFIVVAVLLPIYSLAGGL